MRITSRIFALLLGTVLSAEAALIRYEISGEIASSPYPTAMAVGDSFAVFLTLDTSAATTSSQPEVVQYLGAVQDFGFSLLPGSSGNYAGGTFLSNDLSMTDGLTSSPIAPDSLGFSAQPGGASAFSFAPIDGTPLGMLEFLLIPNTDTLIDFSSGGIPVLRTEDFDLGPPYSGVRFYFGPEESWWTQSPVYATITEIRAVNIPEPASATALLSALALGWAGHRRRGRNQNGRFCA